MLFLKPLTVALVMSLLIATVAQAQETFDVRHVQIKDMKSVLATVQSVDETVARARIGGTVSMLNVDEGSFVQADEVLAQVHDEKLKLELDAISARIASLNAEKQLAQTALARIQRLKSTGAASQARLDEARTNLDVALKNLKSLQSEEEIIRQREREGNILAPASGRVLKVHVTGGSVVLPGEAIATIAEETFILRLEVPERHAALMKVGETVWVGDRGVYQGSDRQREGLVRQVYPEIKMGRLIADVTVNELGDFFVGERVEVFLKTGERSGFEIPTKFLTLKNGYSAVRLENGQEIIVQPGRKSGEMIEILSGLREGDILVAGDK